MPAMTPTQIKTFARLVTLTTAAATTVRSAVAAAAVYAEAMQAGDGTPFELRKPLGRLKYNLGESIGSLLAVETYIDDIRQFVGLPLAVAVLEPTEAAYMPATEAAELCAS